MNGISDTLRTSVVEYCSAIGANPLLVQGAGGNVSWKEEDTLWVKASGTWLAEATEKDIFVSVDLPHLRTAIETGDFSVIPRLRGESALRPSIETLLHALMPHRVVVHLHAIEVLAHLIRVNCHTDFLSLLDPSIHWAMVDYHKPGPALAKAVSTALAQNPNTKVIFLRKHGVVMGGADIAEVSQMLDRLIAALATVPVGLCDPPRPSLTESSHCDQYILAEDANVQQLALNAELFNRLGSQWALYPDHVVFLGAKAYAYTTWEAFGEEHNGKQELPELVFILGNGVFVKPSFNKAKSAQLRCYYDVLARQDPSSPVEGLTSAQIAELLNWDAEQYRINLAQ